MVLCVWSTGGCTTLLCVLLYPAMSSSVFNSPPTVRVTTREWNLPINSQVGRYITEVKVIDQDTHHSNLTIAIERNANLYGPFPFYDGSPYFSVRDLKKHKTKSQRGERTYEIILSKSLLGNFNVSDQFNLNIVGKDGEHSAKLEVYGRIEEARPIYISSSPSIESSSSGPPMVMVPPTPSSIPISSPTSPNSSLMLPNTQDDDTQMGSTLTLTVTLVPIVVILPALMAAFLCRGRLKKACCKGKKVEGGKRDIDNVISNETEFTDLAPSRKDSMALSTYSTSSYSEPPDSVNKENNAKMDPLEFPRHHLKIYGILGEGCFGQVWKCEALNINGVKGTTTVAVKTLKEAASDKEKKDLLQELEVMKMLELDPHPNVVRLLGCCTQGSEKDPIFVIMEYVAKGKLQEFLRKSRAEHYYGNLYGSSQKLTSRDLTQFAHQVARGMEYLAAKKVIHRDLAARNILVTDLNVCKVADFGFSRDVMANNIYERKTEGRLPIRWMGPESLYDNIYTTKTDVWSFGVLLWEIVTLGSTPYPGMSGSEVMKKVKEGYRLEKPEHCDREIYNMMFYCWDKDPAERPSFTQLVKDLEALLTKETDYIDLNQFPDHAYYNEVSLSGERV